MEQLTPTGDSEPAGQEEQLVLSVGEEGAWPGSHVLQLLAACSSWYFPPGQARQADCPSWFPKVPGEHGEQLVLSERLWK